MNDQATLKRLHWACRRGMLELDLILIPFLEQHYSQLPDEQKQAFERLLECPDPELLSWLMGHEIPSDQALIAIVAIIKHHAISLS